MAKKTEKDIDTLDVLTTTLSRYESCLKNLSKEDLAGKYKKSFEKLKNQLSADLKAYLIDTTTGNLWIGKDPDGKACIGEIQKVIDRSKIGEKASKAAFKDVNIDEIVEMANETRRQVVDQAWWPYMERHLRPAVKTA